MSAAVLRPPLVSAFPVPVVSVGMTTVPLLRLSLVHRAIAGMRAQPIAHQLPADS